MGVELARAPPRTVTGSDGGVTMHANRSLSIMGELEAAAAAAVGAVMTAMTAGVTTVELGSSGRHWRMQTPPSLILKLFRVTNCSIETNQRMYDCINESESK